MENKKLLSISIIILAVSIVFSSIWIGHSLGKDIRIQTTNSQASTEKALLTEKEGAEYLNISIDEFKNILLKDTKERIGLQSYETYRFIPYVEINNKKMFSKKELDEWIKYNTFNKH